jgi:hypothetical protein
MGDAAVLRDAKAKRNKWRHKIRMPHRSPIQEKLRSSKLFCGIIPFTLRKTDVPLPSGLGNGVKQLVAYYVPYSRAI